MRGGTTTLMAANGPIVLWSYAMRHFCFNDYRCTGYAANEGRVPYDVVHNRPYEGLCVPWGCAVQYLTTEADKFASRRKPGIIVGYGSESGWYELIDLC